MYSSPLLRCLALAIGLPAMDGMAADKNVTLTVAAGDVDRRQAIVTFDLPEGARQFQQLRGADGSVLPLQVDAHGRATYREPALKRGASKTYQLATFKATAPAVIVKQEGAVLKIAAGGRPIAQYQTEPGEVPSPEVKSYFRHGAYLHPVTTPAGKIVTADYPADHRWHRGIWLGWTDTEFEGRHPDFWNMGKEKDGKFTGSVEFSGLNETWNGPVHGGFTSRHRFVDWTSGSAKPVLNETWQVSFYADDAGGPWIFDLISTQECAGAAPLKLPKYHYGGLGLRGPAQWDPAQEVSFLTANGDDRLKGDGSKANWVHMGGNVDGAPAGIAILCHPANFRAPQPLRLNPKNPQLCLAPSADGDWQIVPGKPYVSRYRFVVADGKADAAMLETLWQDYSKPVSVTVQVR
jgi:hypothetical protein